MLDRGLIPNPCVSDVEKERFSNCDLEKHTGRELWAEKLLVELELANRIYEGAERRVIWVGDSVVTDIGWLEERVRRINAEMRRRRNAA